MKCIGTMQSDATTYTETEYNKMEQELQNKINLLIEETENKYCVQPMIEVESPKTRVKIFILNKAMDNNPLSRL